jgi:hypothetical protein
MNGEGENDFNHAQQALQLDPVRTGDVPQPPKQVFLTLKFGRDVVARVLFGVKDFRVFDRVFSSK